MRSSRVETNPIALSQAAALGDERKDKGGRMLLHGIPLLLKDSVVTLHEEGMVTIAGTFCATVLLPSILHITAFGTILGSYALLASVVPWDAFDAAKSGWA